MRAGKLKDYGFFWVTLGLFTLSISLHWTFAWYAFVEDESERNQPIRFRSYFDQTLRDTMENWQSEFLQLMWQVGGLSFLWFVGSAQSKSSNDRLEDKVDMLIRRLDPDNAKKLIDELEKKYPKK